MDETTTGAGESRNSSSWPQEGDPHVVSVVPRAGYGAQIITVLWWAIPLFILCAIIWGGTSYLIGMVVGDTESGIGLLLSFFSGLAIAFALIWLLTRPIRLPYQRTLITLSPVGIEVRDSLFGVRTRLRWEDVIGCAKVTSPQGAPCAASPAQATIDTDPRFPADGYTLPLRQGIIGWVEQEFPDPIPKPWEEITRVQKTDPNSGKRQGAIPLSLGGTNNPSNQIIRYLLHYCPHLFQGPPALSGSSPGN